MKKRIDFDYDEESGLTIARLETSIGNFCGMSCKHPDDPLHPSFIVGTNIAEARANINMINKQLELKRYELKGLKRLKGSMPSDIKGYHYVENLYDAILDEVLKLKREKAEWKHFIDATINGRSIFIRSRTTNKEERGKFLKELGQRISDLNKLTKDKDKTD